MLVHGRLKTIASLTLLVFLLFLLHIIFSYIYIRTISLSEIQEKLTQFNNRIDNDLVFKGNSWDISKYNADIFTPYPNGSSGFSKPLYIITTDGYIIERTNPITGLLNTSDFKHLLQFNKPTTIHTISNEKWRVFSLPLEYKNRTIGVILLAYYKTQNNDLEVIDQKLITNADYIRNSLIIKPSGAIDYTGLDIRNIHYEYSFEIVDSFNNVIVNNGRVPTFIDPSYLKRFTQNPVVEIVSDEITNVKYQLISKVIVREKHPVGIIVSAETIQPLEQMLSKFVLFSLIIAILLIGPFGFYIIYKIVSIIALNSRDSNSIDLWKIKSISFDIKSGKITVNNTVIEIPYASNQYYLCERVFNNPKKYWESDELLEKMGEIDGVGSSRKVYDAMIALHKRIGFKLVEYKDKTYRMNQHLLSVIRK